MQAHLRCRVAEDLQFVDARDQRDCLLAQEIEPEQVPDVVPVVAARIRILRGDHLHQGAAIFILGGLMARGNPGANGRLGALVGSATSREDTGGQDHHRDIRSPFARRRNHLLESTGNRCHNWPLEPKS